MDDIFDFFGGADTNADLYSNYDDSWFDAGNYSNDLASLSDIGNYQDLSGYSDLPTDFSGYSWVPADTPTYSPEAYALTGAMPAQDFVGPQQSSIFDGDIMAKLYGAEDWAKKHSGLTSFGVGALSFLSSQNAARRARNQQKKAYSSYLADKAAQAAKQAKINAPWVETPYRTRTAVVGPTVADRYGISSRGGNSFAPPSNYNYYSNNRVAFAHGGAAVGGTSGGQDDDIHALLSSGEYVMDADVVSALGDGNNAAGAAKLDSMRENIRAHKRSGPLSNIPPKAKKPEAYLPKKGK